MERAFAHRTLRHDRIKKTSASGRDQILAGLAIASKRKTTMEQ